MSMVRFAMLCDVRGKRSPEYTAWWSCRECLLDVCDECSKNQDDESGRADCKLCTWPSCKHDNFLGYCATCDDIPFEERNHA